MLAIEHGKIISYFIINDKWSFDFLYGFLLIISINQVLLTPCILLHTSFKIALYLVIIIDSVLVIISFFLKKKNNYKIIENKLLTIIIVSLVIIQMAFTTISYKSNADDSFYVSLSTSSIDSKSIYIEEPSMGYKTDETLISPTEQLPTIELQIAILSKIMNLNPAIISHSVLPAIIIFIAYLSFYYFVRTFLNDKNSKIFLIILAMIILFTGFSIKFRAGELLTRTWQGKAIFLNVGLTMVIANLIRLNKNNTIDNIVLLIISNLFSLALSPTAIFIIPFTYLSFGVLKLLKLKWKDIGCLIITFTPIMIYILIYIFINQTVEVAYAVPKDDVNIIECLKYYGSIEYLIYYTLSIIVIFLIGEPKEKEYFVYAQLINLLTIWNPLFSNIIAKHFTSSAVFWRIIWIAPIEFSIAFAMIKTIEIIERQQLKVCVCFIFALMIIIPGKFIYTNFKITENLENIPQNILNQTNYILEQSQEDNEIIVLALPEPQHNATMRQISSRIKLIFSRELYIDKIKNENEILKRKNLYQLYFNNYIYSIEEFNKIVEELKIDWIIVDNNNFQLIDYLNKSVLKENCDINGEILYKRM